MKQPKHPCTYDIRHTSYWNFFTNYYSPKLRELDILLKSIEGGGISTAEASDLLCVTEQSVREIMKKNGIKIIDRCSLLQIMMHGNSSLCRLLQREFKCGSPNVYHPGEIAYIYGLQVYQVEEACNKTSFGEEIPAELLPEVLDKIHIYIMAS